MTPTYWTTRLVRETPPNPIPEGMDKLRGPDSVAALHRTLYGDSPQEVMVAYLLDSQHRVRGIHTVSTGIVDAALVHPREVYRAAILANASAIIIAHHHPSGDPNPSPEDRAVSRQLADAGKTLGIRFLDHVVVGEEDWRSAMPGT